MPASYAACFATRPRPQVDSDFVYLPQVQGLRRLASADVMGAGAAGLRRSSCHESGCCGGGVSLDEPPQPKQNPTAASMKPARSGNFERRQPGNMSTRFTPQTAARAARRHSGSREGRRKILLRRAPTEPEPDMAVQRRS